MASIVTWIVFIVSRSDYRIGFGLTGIANVYRHLPKVAHHGEDRQALRRPGPLRSRQALPDRRLDTYVYLSWLCLSDHMS